MLIDNILLSGCKAASPRGTSLDEAKVIDNRVSLEDVSTDFSHASYVRRIILIGSTATSVIIIISYSI